MIACARERAQDINSGFGYISLRGLISSVAKGHVIYLVRDDARQFTFVFGCGNRPSVDVYETAWKGEGVNVARGYDAELVRELVAGCACGKARSKLLHVAQYRFIS